MAANPDQCALAADGSLLDASAITFYNNPDDDTPLPDSSATSARMRNAVRSWQATEQGRFDPRDELRRYLESPLVEGVTDVVGYWGVHQF